MKDVQDSPDDRKLDTRVRRRGARYALAIAASLGVILAIAAAYFLYAQS